MNEKVLTNGKYLVIKIGTWRELFMSWKHGEPPRDKRTYLLKFKSGIVCTGSYRYGFRGEPSQDTIAWRCDCCGRFANPEYWMEVFDV